MEDRPCNVGAVAERSAYNDERFDIILTNAQDLRNVSRDLATMANQKFNELLGQPDPKPIGENCKPLEVSWADRVINEQHATMTLLREILERLSLV